MAKKKTTTDAATKDAPVKLSSRDKRPTTPRRARRPRRQRRKSRKDPYVEIPSRTLANVHYSPRKKIIEMATPKTGVSSSISPRLRPTCAPCSSPAGCKKLLCAVSQRACEAVLQLKTYMTERKKTPSTSQTESDTIIRDVESCWAPCARSYIYMPRKKGDLVGNIIINDSGFDIDCSEWDRADMDSFYRRTRSY